MVRLKRSAVVSLALGLIVAVSAFADETPPGPAKPWKNESEFSFVSANGNTKSTTTSGKDTLTYTISKTSLQLTGGGLGARSAGSVVAEQYNAAEKVSYNVTERDYLFERFGWDKDRFAGIRNRYDSSVGIGRTLLKRDNDTLLSEIGGGYISEKRIHANDNDFATGRGYLKYTHTISPTANFSQDAEYVQSLKEGKDSRIKTETAIIAALSTHLSLKASYVWKYVGAPPPGVGRSDTLTSIALIAVY